MAATRLTFASDDTDVVEDMFRQNFGKVELKDTKVALVSDVVADDRYFFGRYEFVGRLKAWADIDGFSVSAGGDFRWAVGDDRGDGRRQAFLGRSGRPNTTVLADTVVDQVWFDAEALQRTARAAYSDDGLQVVFDGATPVSPAADRLIRVAVTHAVEAGPLALESDLVSASLYQFLAAVVLEGFPLRGDRDARARTTRALRDGYRRAVVFMDDFASLPITLDDVAEAASLTSADLRAAFRSQSFGEISVRDHLRAVRLDAAHRDLIAGDPTRGDTVRAIALRWGFSPSRLAALHRQTYGTTPKWVLDR